MNLSKNDLIKKLLPGLLPLLVFILADEIWGTKIGLYVAITFGFGQLLFVYFKEKRIDKFIIIDTALIAFMGFISIILENDIFFKLKPAIIEIILCVILGISAFSPKNIIMMMSGRYFQDIEINDEQLKQLRRSMKIMFFVFTFHTLLVVYSAFFMSKEAWAFISAGLFYILFALVFLFEYVSAKLKLKKNLSKAEWFPVIDTEGKIIGKATREQCHTNNTLLHPVVHLHVINKHKQLLLQKRNANKDVQPNKWDTAVGGHVDFGENIEQALYREVKEEIYLENFTPTPILNYIWKSDIESEMVYSFLTKYDGELGFNTNEIQEIKFWSINEIANNLGKNVFTPNFEHEFNLLRTKKII